MLSLTTLSKCSTSCSLSLYCCPRNYHIIAATCCPWSQPQSTLPPRPRPRSMLPPRPRPQSVSPLSSSSSSLSLSRCPCRPWLCLPWSVPPPSTSTPPPSECVAAVVLDPDLPRYQALTYLWLFVWNLWLFVTVCDCLCKFECEWIKLKDICSLMWLFVRMWMKFEYFYRIFVNEIRICFIGLSKLITKDDNFMFYTISVNFTKF
jgi:hypothetical protein